MSEVINETAVEEEVDEKAITTDNEEARKAEIVKQIEELEKNLPANMKIIKIDDEKFLKDFRDLSLTYSASLNLINEMAKDKEVSDSPLVRSVYNTYTDLYKKYELVKENFKNDVVMKNFPNATNYDLNFTTGIVLVTLAEAPADNATPIVEETTEE